MNESPSLVGGAVGPVIWKVPQAYAGRVLTPAAVAIRNVLGLSPLIVLVGPIAASFFVMHGADWKPDTTTLAVACGIVLVGVGAFVALMIGDWRPGTAFVLGQLRRHVRERPDALVSPDELGVVAVEVIPRCNWNRAMLENATDIGFLKLDPEARELRFEGDRERYRIPADRLGPCSVEAICGRGADAVYGVVVQADVGGRYRDLPLNPLAGLAGRNRAEKAEALCQQIEQLRATAGP